MDIIEMKITNRSESKFGDLSFRVFIKAEDVTPQLDEWIKEQWRDGNSLFAEMYKFQDKEEEPCCEKAQTLKGKNSIYVQFKMFCDEVGKNYEDEKKRLGVEHLSDLEKKFSLGEVEEKLKSRKYEIEREMGLFDQV